MQFQVIRLIPWCWWGQRWEAWRPSLHHPNSVWNSLQSAPLTSTAGDRTAWRSEGRNGQPVHVGGKKREIKMYARGQREDTDFTVPQNTFNSRIFQLRKRIRGFLQPCLTFKWKNNLPHTGLLDTVWQSLPTLPERGNWFLRKKEAKKQNVWHDFFLSGDPENTVWGHAPGKPLSQCSVHSCLVVE